MLISDGDKQAAADADKSVDVSLALIATDATYNPIFGDENEVSGSSGSADKEFVDAGALEVTFFDVKRATGSTIRLPRPPTATTSK